MAVQRPKSKTTVGDLFRRYRAWISTVQSMGLHGTEHGSPWDRAGSPRYIAWVSVVQSMVLNGTEHGSPRYRAWVSTVHSVGLHGTERGSHGTEHWLSTVQSVGLRGTERGSPRYRACMGLHHPWSHVIANCMVFDQEVGIEPGI